MMRRPASVPRAARYSLRDRWWQVGEIRDGKPFGPWRTWRPDGTPLFEARFDSRGRLQGAFKRFHPDGSVAREARYRRGAETGQTVYYRAQGAAGDLFPSTDPRAWQVVVRLDDDGDETRVLLDDQGRELSTEIDAAADTAAGRLDGVFAAAEPDGFLESGALARVLEVLPPPPPPTPDDGFLLPAERPPRRPLDARRFQDLYGVPPPAPLRAWLEAPARRLLGLSPAADLDLAAAGNVVEALIAEHQAAPGRAFGLRALVAGLLPLAVGDGTLAGSLRYCYALGESANAPTDAIYPFDVADDSLGPPVARTLDDLAYALALASGADAGAVSLRALQRAYVRLRGRVALPALAATEARALVDEDDETVGDEAGDHREGFHFRRANQYPRHFFYRARWLVRLLGGHVEGAARDFDPKFEGGLDEQRFERIKGFLREPHVAAYWLLRCHVFADPRLPELLAIAADCPAQLVRDLAALVRELEAGRRQLGAIADWPAVLAAFRALDPLSNRGEDDEGGDGEAEPIAPLAYPEELAAAGAVVEWARREGYSRENLLIYDELDAAALGLARRADPRLVPFLVELHAADPWRASRLLAPWLDGARADLAPLAATARTWLRDQESGALFRWLGGARILQRVGTAEDGALLAAVVEPLLESMFGRGQGFAAALGSLEAKRALDPIMDALITLGVPEAFVPVLEGVVDAETHLVDDARGACALALASVGRGLAAIVAGVTRQLDKKHGHRIQLGQLLAIGRLGAALPEPERAALIARIEDIPRLDAFAAVGQRLALHALGRAGDPAGIVRDGLALERYSDDDTARQRVVLLRLVERSRDLPAELALPYVVTDQLDVHRAAVRCLAARGVPAPELVLYDPYHVAELASRGREVIHAALAGDGGVFRGNLALWLGDHPDPASREVLAANARRLAARADFPAEGPAHYELRWTVRALLRVGGADDVLVELLRGGNPHVADPVLRYADELGAGVARGMAHVFVADQHWRQSTAKAWLARHVGDPAVLQALAEQGLAAADVTADAEEDDDDSDDDDDGGDE